MIYEIVISGSAYEDIQKLKKIGDKVILKKLDRLFTELREHPTTGTGQPEQLKHERQGEWSRRITDKHRLIYRINDDFVIVDVIQAYGHYSDK